MVLRIFVTTDNHVGYNELDPVRGEDAARSFEEAMSIARESEVDFIIQGGDLFHVNKPSKYAFYSVMKTLRHTCLSDKPIEFQVLNHGSLTLDDAEEEYNHMNFEDPNYNLGLPVFAISGNHDDAGGSGSTTPISPLDILSMSGLINHFGRVKDESNITVTPILIEKEGIRVAIYGIASVRDERLYRSFRSNKVKFLRPREEPETWYNILVVHQNHSQHGPTNFLPEQFLPNFMDLVIWGHEHECNIDPVENPIKGFKVMQPGSTVATSLSESEVKPKHVAIITIAPNKLMSYEKIQLKTVRPLILRTVVLKTDAPHITPNDRDTRAKVTSWLMEQVEELISEATSQQSDSEESLLPLIRLRVDYSGGYEVENTTRFSNRFVGRVANSNDILHLIKRRQTTEGRIMPKSVSGTADTEPRPESANGIDQVGRLIHKFLDAEELKILAEKGMEEALSKFVEKDEKVALREGIDSLVRVKMDEMLKTMDQPSTTARALSTISDASSHRGGRHPGNARTTRTAQSKAVTRSAKQKETPEEQLFIDESDPEAINSSEEEEYVAKTTTQPKTPATSTYSRGSRQPLSTNPPIQNKRTPITNPDALDDSDEMFSDDEFN